MIRDQFWKPDNQTRSAIRHGNKLFKEYIDRNVEKYMALRADRLGRLKENNRNAATNSMRVIDVRLITGKEGGQSMLDSTNEQNSIAPAVNQQKVRPAHWFKPGQSGNPNGRKKGSRNKVTEEFLRVLAADFKKHGKSVIERVREESPDVYLRLVAQLVSKDIDVKYSGDVTVQIVRYADIASDKSAESLETGEHPEQTLIEGTAVDANPDGQVAH